MYFLSNSLPLKSFLINWSNIGPAKVKDRTSKIDAQVI